VDEICDYFSKYSGPLDENVYSGLSGLMVKTSAMGLIDAHELSDFVLSKIIELVGQGKSEMKNKLKEVADLYASLYVMVNTLDQANKTVAELLLALNQMEIWRKSTECSLLFEHLFHWFLVKVSPKGFSTRPAANKYFLISYNKGDRVMKNLAMAYFLIATEMDDQFVQEFPKEKKYMKGVQTIINKRQEVETVQPIAGGSDADKLAAFKSQIDRWKSDTVVPVNEISQYYAKYQGPKDSQVFVGLSDIIITLSGVRNLDLSQLSDFVLSKIIQMIEGTGKSLTLNKAADLYGGLYFLFEKTRRGSLRKNVLELLLILEELKVWKNEKGENMLVFMEMFTWFCENEVNKGESPFRTRQAVNEFFKDSYLKGRTKVVKNIAMTYLLLAMEVDAEFVDEIPSEIEYMRAVGVIVGRRQVRKEIESGEGFPEKLSQGRIDEVISGGKKNDVVSNGTNQVEGEKGDDVDEDEEGGEEGTVNEVVNKPDLAEVASINPTAAAKIPKNPNPAPPGDKEKTKGLKSKNKNVVPTNDTSTTNIKVTKTTSKVPKKPVPYGPIKITTMITTGGKAPVPKNSPELDRAAINVNKDDNETKIEKPKKKSFGQIARSPLFIGGISLSLLAVGGIIFWYLTM
jgi:hypothetical protein